MDIVYACYGVDIVRQIFFDVLLSWEKHFFVLYLNYAHLYTQTHSFPPTTANCRQLQHLFAFSTLIEFHFFEILLQFA